MPTPAEKAVQASQEYYRLKQAVQSPGDIYEVKESARAIYLGPDSDVAEVKVTYITPEQDLETAVVSVNGPFVGRIDSLPETYVASTGQTARLLVNPVDIIDNNYDPGNSAARRFNIEAIIDVMFALKTLPDIPSVRADRTLRYTNVPIGGTGTGNDANGTDIVIPIYGRRMATVVVNGNGISMTLSTVNLMPGEYVAPRQVAAFRTPSVLPYEDFRFTAIAVFRASDAARQGVTYDVAIPAVQTGSYDESDMTAAPGFATDQPNIFPVPRGMADLLVLNVRQTIGASAGTLHFCDVYVKVADRET